MDEKIKKWLKRAERDLKAAEILMNAQLYADAVYHAHQAAEKAIKAMLLSVGLEIKEHKISGYFYDEFVVNNPEMEEIYDMLVELEKHWLKSRYPLETSKGIWDPDENYTEELAMKLLSYAKKIVGFVKDQLNY